MTRTGLPPTPAASTEIQGKDGSAFSPVEKSFNLGSPAIAPKQTNGHVSHAQKLQSSQNSNFTLPPPPTRSRTIIQMKPKPQSTESPGKAANAQRSPKASTRKTVSSSAVTTSGGKKQPSSTSMAGKRIARKTAHSVIERRRRSKMNEEFATLKDMIPACTDQEMHKLAILQASIDYLRYLEQCITDLKAANNSLSTPLMQPQAPPPRLNTNMLDGDDIDEDEEDDHDTAMGNAAPSSAGLPVCPTVQNHQTSYRSPLSVTASPALDAQSQCQTSSYASSVSTLPSPAFGPQSRNYHASKASFSLSASTSPTIMPSPEEDQEATAALLMLNKDRRHPRGGRGMSVKDLLSS